VPAPGEVDRGTSVAQSAPPASFGAARFDVEFHAGEAEGAPLRHSRGGAPAARVESLAGGRDGHAACAASLRFEVARLGGQAPRAQAALRVEPRLRLATWPGEADDAEPFIAPIVAEVAFGGEVHAAVRPARADQVESAAAGPVRPVQPILGGPEGGADARGRSRGVPRGRRRRGQHPARERAGEGERVLAGAALQAGLPPAAFVQQAAVDLIEQQGPFPAGRRRRRTPKSSFRDAQRSEAAVLAGEPEADLQSRGREDFTGQARDFQRHILRDQRALRRQQVATGVQAPARRGDPVLQQARHHPGELDGTIPRHQPKQQQLAREQQVEGRVREAPQEPADRRGGRTRFHFPASSRGIRMSARVGASRKESVSASSFISRLWAPLGVASR